MEFFIQTKNMPELCFDVIPMKIITLDIRPRSSGKFVWLSEWLGNKFARPLPRRDHFFNLTCCCYNIIITTALPYSNESNINGGK